MQATSQVMIGQPVSVTITPKNPNLVFASIQQCKVVFGDFEIPLMLGSSDETNQSFNLEPVGAFGTEIPNSSNVETLDFKWNAFKWATTASESYTEGQQVECRIKLTKNEPNHNTGTCPGPTAKPTDPSATEPQATEPPATETPTIYQHPKCQQLGLASTTIFTHT